MQERITEAKMPIIWNNPFIVLQTLNSLMVVFQYKIN